MKMPWLDGDFVSYPNRETITIEGVTYALSEDGDIIPLPIESPREVLKEKTQEEKFEEVVTRMLETYKAKNNDYGNSIEKTYDLFGDISFLTRLNDKLNRLNTLCTGTSSKVKEESIDDTILDLATYAVLFLIIRK